jgi:tRNA pseudouridine55 synthase
VPGAGHASQRVPAGKDKRYLARVRLGQATTTYDAQGEVTETHADLPLPGQAAVEAALVPFRGRQQQVPPAYSAIKRGGQKAYELARRGEAVELDARPVEFYSLDLVEWQPPELLLNVHCSAGTYIRSLAHDLGQALGCGAHLSGLRRTATGSFHLTQALPLADLQAAFAAGDWLKFLRPPDAALGDLPSVRLTTEAASRVQRGQPVKLDLPAGWSGDAGPELLARAYNASGDFIAVLRADAIAGVWRPHKVFLEN